MALFGKKKKNENPDVVENAQVVDSANGKDKKKSKKKNVECELKKYLMSV